MLKKLRKNKKGFTLVEVIVVLVILAILAAIMVPSMTGWIDKAKDQSILVKGRTALLAAQTVVSEMSAGDVASPTSQANISDKAKADFPELAKGIALAVGADPGDKECAFTVIDWQITTLAYEEGGKTASYDGTNWTVAKNATP